MISEYDQADKTAEYGNGLSVEPGQELPPLTPETARRLAAVLAPHLVAMRAVTAGTQYADSGGDGDFGDDAVAARRPVSPATKIFIAGMLQRIPA
jgi:hypothetical protein